MTNSEKLYNSITEINEKFLEEAQAKRIPYQFIYAAKCMVAIFLCAVIVVGASVGLYIVSKNIANVDVEDEIANGEVATDYQDYNGPVLPLTFAREETAVVADRVTAFDFADEDYNVNDTYTLYNTSGEDVTVTALYPYICALSEWYQDPSIEVDGEQVEYTLLCGGVVCLMDGDDVTTVLPNDAGSFDDIASLLEDGTYLEAALSGDCVIDLSDSFRNKAYDYYEQLVAESEELVDWNEITPNVTFEEYYKAICAICVMRGFYEDAELLSDVGLREVFDAACCYEQVLYAKFTVTIPAGGSVTLVVDQYKNPNCNNEYKAGDTACYEVATTLGSNISFTYQVAAVYSRSGLNIVDSNLDLDDDSFIITSEMDQGVARYYIEYNFVN